MKLLQYLAIATAQTAITIAKIAIVITAIEATATTAAIATAAIKRRTWKRIWSDGGVEIERSQNLSSLASYRPTNIQKYWLTFTDLVCTFLGMHINVRYIKNTGFNPWLDNQIEWKTSLTPLPDLFFNFRFFFSNFEVKIHKMIRITHHYSSLW